MFADDAEFLDGFEVEIVANTEPVAKRKRCSAVKKWSVAEERTLIEFLMENRGFERPTAQHYYKRFAEVAKCEVEWKVARNKLRNMRTAYNRAKTWESSTGAGSMDGETMKATLLRKCHYFQEFDELFGARVTDNFDIDDTLDEPNEGFNSTEIDETTTSSVGCESCPSTSRRGIYSRTGVSDIMQLHKEMMEIKRDKIAKDTEFRAEELTLKREEIEMKKNEIEGRERIQILELEMKERVAMAELKLKYRQNN